MNRTTGGYLILGLLAAGLILLLVLRPGAEAPTLDTRSPADEETLPEPGPAPEPPPGERGPAGGAPPVRPFVPAEAAPVPTEAVIRGRVVDPEGKAVRDAEVYAAGHEDVAVLRFDLAVHTLSGGEDGSFELTLPPGVLDLVVFRSGFRPTVLPDLVAVEGRVLDLGAVGLETGASISGRVVTVDGLSVPDAEVVAYRDESLAPSVLLPGPRGAAAWGGRATSDRGGDFRVDGLPEGRFRLRAEGVGIRMAGEAVEAAAGAAGVRIVVKRVRVATGLVLSVNDQTPVAGATVTVAVRSPAFSGRLIVQTDAAGRFAVDLSDERFEEEGVRFDVQVAADAFEDASRTDLTLAEVAPEGALRIELVPAPPAEPGTLRGRVLYDTGEPFRNGRLTLSFSRESRAPQVFETTTGPDGEFEVGGITPGEYSLRTAPRSGRVLLDTGKRLVIPPGGVETTEISIPRGGDLELSIVDARGDPVKGAQVTVFDGEGARVGAWLMTEGARIVSDVPPGGIRVRAVAPGYEAAEVTATAVVGTRIPVRLVLEPR